MYDFYEEKIALAREILSKAGLTYISEHLGRIEDWNLIGTSPKTMFSGLPMKVLRCLNSKDGIAVLQSEDSRVLLRELHKKSIASFNEKWNCSQCLFWLDYQENVAQPVINRDIIQILDLLKGFKNESKYNQFKQYLIIREEIRNFADLPLIPKEDDFNETIEKAESIFEYILHEDIVDYLLSEQIHKVREFYEYEDEKYQITLLKSLTDFLNESRMQKNCLWSYIPLACTGYTTILTLRRKNQKDVSYVTIEVQGNPEESPVLWQVKGRYNKEVSDGIKDWVLNYCDERGIETYECDDLFCTVF